VAVAKLEGLNSKNAIFNGHETSIFQRVLLGTNHGGASHAGVAKSGKNVKLDKLR
jgi:hypothetical protein